MLKLDIYTMKIRPFFVEILLLVKKNKYIKIKNINKYIKNDKPPERFELSTPGLQDQCSNP